MVTSVCELSFEVRFELVDKTGNQDRCLNGQVAAVCLGSRACAEQSKIDAVNVTAVRIQHPIECVRSDSQTMLARRTLVAGFDIQETCRCLRYANHISLATQHDESRR